MVSNFDICHNIFLVVCPKDRPNKQESVHNPKDKAQSRPAIHTPTPSKKRKEPESSSVDSFPTPVEIPKSGTTDDRVTVGPINRKVPMVLTTLGPLDKNPSENNTKNKTSPNSTNNATGNSIKSTDTLPKTKNRPT